MRAALSILSYMLRSERQALLRGAALALIVLLMGAALLGLSGWFITAAAAAGIAGAGTVFDVFRPSAMVRFLALGRTAARYGERLLTHDATLRALMSLRLRLLERLSRGPYERLLRLRAAQALNRVTADVDALDGLPLRFILPVLAGLAAQAIVFAVLWWLVDLRVALLVFAGFIGGAVLAMGWGMRAANRPARRAETAAQAFRTRLIDLITARGDLAVYGQLAAQEAAVMGAEARRAEAAARLDRLDRLAGVALGLIGAGVVAAVLWLAGGIAAGEEITPAKAALAVFAALALIETAAPLRRAIADYGRIALAARRVAGMMELPEGPGAQGGQPEGRALELRGVTHGARLRGAVHLGLAPGETLALAGPSGSGKSTVLLIAAGILSAEGGTATLGGVPLAEWDEGALRRAVTLVPQRAGLMQGSLAENLRLAAPGAEDAALWAALDAVQLGGLARARDGLETMLGPRGAGLSGGEARRLVLARALLRAPDVLLLDEPTEGLDRETARAVMEGIRAALPGAAILIAAHRQEELDFAGSIVNLEYGCGA